VLEGSARLPRTRLLLYSQLQVKWIVEAYCLSNHALGFEDVKSSGWEKGWMFRITVMLVSKRHMPNFRYLCPLQVALDFKIDPHISLDVLRHFHPQIRNLLYLRTQVSMALAY
jgi:hypothetical protein